MVILYLKQQPKSEILFKKTKGKKRKGSIVNYRNFVIPSADTIVIDLSLSALIF
jgi:hypothetical protein